MLSLYVTTVPAAEQQSALSPRRGFASLGWHPQIVRSRGAATDPWQQTD